jgi:hypothetical protein
VRHWQVKEKESTLRRTDKEVFTGKKAQQQKSIPPSIISRSGREPRPELYLTEIFMRGTALSLFFSNHLLTKAGREKTVKVVLRNHVSCS